MKDSPPEILAACIREVADGQVWLEANRLRRILDKLRLRGEEQASSSAPASIFTPRERTALRMLLDGASNKSISEHMGIGVSHVKFLVRNLFRKTGANTRAQLVRLALERYRDEIGQEKVEAPPENGE